MLLQVEGLPHCVRMLDFDIEPHFHISRNELVAGAQVPSYQQLNFIAFPRHLPWSPNASITSLYQISCFFRQLFHALLALHQRNIAHLDIKPQNLMIESPSNSSLVLIDFGLARYFTSPSQPFEGVGGTAGYASLEFWRQQAWNGAPGRDKNGED